MNPNSSINANFLMQPNNNNFSSNSNILTVNSNKYMVYNQYYSVNSQDRNILKNPDAAEFNVQFPQDYKHISGISMHSWTFPAAYDTFSKVLDNITLYMKITEPYNPENPENPTPSNLQLAIYEGLMSNVDNHFTIEIPAGFYTQPHITNTLEILFNEAVTSYLTTYIAEYYPAESSNFNKYDQFVITYNQVNQKILFGNKSSAFELLNKRVFVEYYNNTNAHNYCNDNAMQNIAEWGLPSNLGFTPENIISEEVANNELTLIYEGEHTTPWLEPDPNHLGAKITYIEPVYKLNLLGPSFYYIDIPELNCIDETVPSMTGNSTTNNHGGYVKSAFAKIGVNSIPLAQWYDANNQPTRVYNPPRERLNSLTIRVRNQNGSLVRFGNLNFSLMFKITMLVPQIERSYSVYTPEAYTI